jgi:hypothetical protein
MIVTVRTGYVPVRGVCYPIDITNNGAQVITVDITTTINTLVSSASISVAPAATGTVYAVTDTAFDDVSFDDHASPVNLHVTTIEPSGVEYGSPSSIQVFELPGGAPGEVIPTLENIALLMRIGRYFRAPGELKVWRPDAL